MTVLEARRTPRRRGRDRGADAARLPPRHVLGRVPGGGRLAGVRALAARAPRPALGAPALLLCASAARRARGGAGPRPRRDGRVARRARTRATARRWRAFVAPVPGPLRRVARRRCCRASRRSPGRRSCSQRLRLNGMLDWARLLLMPAARARRTSSSRATARAPGCTAPAMHGDVPPDGAGSAIAAAHLNLMGHAVGWPSPRGRRRPACRRARRPPGRARRARRARGAPVDAGSRPSAGRVAGVELDGRRARCAAAIVIADVTPHGAARARGRRAAGRLRRRAARATATGRRRSSSTGRSTVPSRGRRAEAREAGTVHVGGAEQEMLDALAAADARLPEQPVPALRPAVARRPDARARRPAHRLGLHARSRGRRLGARERAPRRARRGADRALRARLPRPHPRPPRALPGRPRAAQRRTSSAATSARGSYALDQLVFRPAAEPLAYRTPVRGLFLGSAATFPGGAVHGVPGRAAARAALHESRIRRRWTRVPRATPCQGRASV